MKRSLIDLCDDVVRLIKEDCEVLAEPVFDVKAKKDGSYRVHMNILVKPIQEKPLSKDEIVQACRENRDEMDAERRRRRR